MWDYYVAVDEGGYYYDPDTGESIDVYWDDNLNPYDADGNALQFWGGDSGFSGSEITKAVRDVLISIWGNPAAVRANTPQNRYPGPSTSGGVPVVVPPSPDRERPTRSDGAGIHLSTNMLMLIVGGVLLFMVGQSRGGRR